MEIDGGESIHDELTPEYLRVMIVMICLGFRHHVGSLGTSEISFHREGSGRVYLAT